MESNSADLNKQNLNINLTSVLSEGRQLTLNASDEILEQEVQVSPRELVSVQNLHESVLKIESLSQLQTKQFEFNIHEESKKSFVVVTDSETNEIIRQIPSEEVLELASKIDKLQEEIFGTSLGLLFDQEI